MSESHAKKNSGFSITSWVIAATLSIPLGHSGSFAHASPSSFDAQENTDVPRLTRFEKKKKRKSFYVYEGEIFNPSAGYDGVPQGGMTSEFIFYKTRVESGFRPLVVIFPPISGVTFIERTVARYFARRGFHAVIAKVGEDISDRSRPLSDIDPFLMRETSKVRALLDILTEERDVDSSRISVFGVSLGGIRSALLMGIEPRVGAGAFFVAGGDLAEIIAFAGEGKIRRYRKHRMAVETIPDHWELYRRLQKLITYDPLNFASHEMGENVFMVISTRDSVVSTHNQFKLWEALGKPHREVVSTGHRLTAIRFRSFLKGIMGFYLDRWAIDEKAVRAPDETEDEFTPQSDLELEMALEALKQEALSFN